MKTFNTTLNISSQRISDLMVGAFEGGSNYWIERINNVTDPRDDSSIKPFYSDPEYWAGKFELEVLVDDDDPVILRSENIEKGLAKLVESYPRRISEIIEENDDAETSDVLLQTCCFGEIVYG